MKNILLLCCLFVCTFLVAQENFVFSPINSSKGLSDNRVRSICQLDDGRIVVITEGLLNLYDGVRFLYVHFDDRKAYDLRDYPGRHNAYVDKDKRLWLKNNHKLFVFDLGREIFISNPDSVFDTLGANGRVNDFFMDTRRDFWWTNENDELIYRNNTRKETTTFLTGISMAGGKKDKLRDIAVLNGQVFLFFKAGGMVCYDIGTKKRKYIEDPLHGKNSFLNSLTVSTYGKNIYQLLSGNKTGLLLTFNTTTRKWKKELETAYELNSIRMDNKGNCWISSMDGLWMIEKNNHNKRLISPLYLVDGRIVEAEVSTQYFDDKGGLWIGTIDRGVLYYHPDRFIFNNHGRSIFNLHSSKKISVRCFTEMDGQILVGTQIGLFRYKKESPTIEPVKAIPPNTICEMLMKDSKGRVWLCTQNMGLYCLEKNRVTHYSTPVHCLYLFEGSDHRFYACTDKGVGLFDPKSGKYDLARVPVGQKISFVYQLTRFSQNQLLGYSDEGLLLYDPLNNSVSIPGKESALQQHTCHHYHCLYKDVRGLIWLGTMDGLNVFNPADGTTTCFTERTGLVNNSIRSIIEDKSGKIWVSTSNGISRIDVRKVNGRFHYSFLNYNKFDGIIETEFLPRSVFKTSVNSLLWGGLDGFNELDLARIDQHKQPLSAPLITKLLVSGTEIRQGETYAGNTILNQSISSTSEIRLKHFQNFLGFEFSALNYVNPSQTYYRYILEGAENTWNEVKTSVGVGLANYTNLSPGTYRLKVYASNNNRQWGNKRAEITVVILPPFWRSPFAYAFYWLLFAGILYILLTYYDRQQKRKMDKKQKADLDQLKYSFFTNISHELRTPLTLILTPLESIVKKIEDESLKKQLNSIYRNANELLKLVNQLLDFRKLEMKGETLELNYCNIGEFLEVIAFSFREMASNNGLDFVLECMEDNLYAYVDTDKLHKIVNNLLSNAIKFTPKGGKIVLSAFKDPTEPLFTIQVSDTGIGIPEVEASQIFERFYQVKKQKETNTGSGLGLHLVKEYVQMHKGTVEVESRLNEGSTFIVRIPTNMQPEEDMLPDDDIKTDQPHVKLLVVEDNIEFCNFLQDAFSEEYHVTVANNGKDGLDAALSIQPDLVITDVMMPEMTGTELCRRLKKDIRTSHIPVILLTAKTSDKAQIEGFEAGADVYVTKPFNMDILTLHIQHLIEQKNERKNLFKNAIIINPDNFTSTNADKGLIENALRQIEKNLDNASYSVEQLSKDLCMDRTGLYRKLSAIVGQTPSEFIRSVRLKRAALLLAKGLPVSEVAGHVGFGTTSYFTKCFQDEFGIKPSQYKNMDQ